MSAPVSPSVGVEDRVAVLDLYARQSHAVDGGDAPGWAGTFTADGVFESPTYQLVARGREELTEFARMSYTAARERGEQLRHHVGAVVIDVGGDDRLKAVAYLLIVATSAQGSRIERSVRIFDELVRTDPGWRVAVRKVVRDG